MLGLPPDVLNYRRGWDDVRRRIRGTVDPTFDRKVDRRAYTVGISQVLTRNALLTLNFETQTDEGFLNSPYRSVRYLDPTVPRGFSFESERYPDTHSSNARSFRQSRSSRNSNGCARRSRCCAT